MHLLWYYIAPPLSAWTGRWSRNPQRRFHARQSYRLGWCFVWLLVLALAAELASGFVPRIGVSWVRSAVVLAALPLAAAWVWAVANIAQHGHCKLPMLAPPPE